MQSIVFLGPLGCVLATAAAAQTPPAASPFMDRVAGAEQILTVDEAGRLGGMGGTTLTAAVDGARYVSIGEAHFSMEIPRFTVALCRQMATRGLKAMAVETGPEATRILNRYLRRPDRIARLSAFMQAHPDAIAFQNNRAENDMAAACAQAAGPAFQLWGLDQEFFGASGFLLAEMAAASPGRTARPAIDRLIVQDRAATAAAMASHSPGEFLIYRVTDAQMEDARTAIAKDGGRRVARLFDALAETRAIFLASSAGTGDANGRRARLIKRTLAGYLATAPADSRVLMKFGDAHMVKGVNTLGQRDLGNFIAERADGDGVSSLHILVMGAQGQLGRYDGVGRQVRIDPYTPATDADYPWFKDLLAMRPAQSSASDWLLLDVRPLRALRTRDVPAAWRPLVTGFDMVVVAPKLTPASLVGVTP